MNALVYVDIDRGIHKVKLKNALIEKRKKLCGFSFSINVANFEAFCRTKKLISNLFFLKSEHSTFSKFWFDNFYLSFKGMCKIIEVLTFRKGIKNCFGLLKIALSNGFRLNFLFMIYAEFFEGCINHLF